VVQVRYPYLEITNGTPDGELKLYGLGDFRDEGADLGAVRELVQALTTLLGEVKR
jgi:hypothetical protein